MRYAAFLRGVSPMNCQMPALKAALEQAGYQNVVTVLSSGNAVLDARKASNEATARAIERAMEARLGRTFFTIVRRIDELEALLAADPYASWKLPAQAKRVVTFLPKAHVGTLRLPIEQDGARILAVRGAEVLSCYEPGPKGPVFMTLLERTFGKEITTRTWDTVKKVAAK